MIKNISCANLNRNIYANKVNTVSKPDALNNVAFKSDINNQTISPVFETNFTNVIRTQLTSKEQKIYSQVLSNLSKDDRAKADSLLRKGILLNSNSNDNSTVLDNMHKIITEKRAQGLDKQAVLSELINTLDNPFVITQKFGDIPQKELDEIINNPKSYTPNSYTTPENYTQAIQNVHSSTCVAASIEFDLASKQPAEFARMAQGLTSENICVEKKLKSDDISKNPVETIFFLNEFKTDYKQNNWNEIIVNMRPDRNAIVRARIQMTNKDPNERSLIDVLMQSTFMNIGSQHTYNSLTDQRTGKYNPDNTGLIDIEKSFAETIATGKNKTSITYQIINDDGMITGYEYGLDKMKKHIFDALDKGENVIVGYTQQDETNKVINGHEITIVRLEKDKNGKEVFVCNDTDDESNAPVKYYVDDLLPAIHHAGLPNSVIGKEDLPPKYEAIEYYKDLKNKQAA